MSEITIKFLAEKLNLASSTVSRALNDSHEISDKTKKRVLDLAKSLNFQPNANARSLREQKSKTIGVIVPDRVNNFFNLVIEGLESVCREEGYSLIVYNSYEDVEQEKKIIYSLLGGKVDAVVISLADEEKEVQHLEWLREKNIPILFFDRVARHVSGLKYTTNDLESAYLATKHLLDKGCKKVAFLGLSNTSSVGKARQDGFIKAHIEHGLVYDKNLLIGFGHDDIENQKVLEKLFYKINRPDGVLAAAEKLGIATLRALHNLRIKIPEQVRIVSFTNMQFADLLSPALSTIAQPAFELGSTCAKELIRGLKSKNINLFEEKKIELPSKFTIRDSSK
ncbi:LacI family DNA-binding transcriptional regulator [Belliella kenyensis]|uniref:LacI family DNA-binding transcriptional regulator n=1 Tax=Belliella kenyensis TaxID=1472724 RepID=A0ABV8EFW0_9BACT|nr:LacI family DNA-binding transcriptional regulator [Belliella kenyensis]MCH7401755.1 LacI family transcriptional regulator [Belliella kenyensis]MDN3604254.1 LacI family DNA-binding transcriptional regulator [Belliella kenyensis]